MASSGLKTAKGKRNKALTGDGRKKPTLENMCTPKVGKNDLLKGW